MGDLPHTPRILQENYALLVALARQSRLRLFERPKPFEDRLGKGRREEAVVVEIGDQTLLLGEQCIKLAFEHRESPFRQPMHVLLHGEKPMQGFETLAHCSPAPEPGGKSGHEEFDQLPEGEIEQHEARENHDRRRHEIDLDLRRQPIGETNP